MTTPIDFHNDIHTLAYSSHDNHGDAIEAACKVLDDYKELLRDEKATNITMVMSYLTPEAQVALERMSFTPPSETDTNYRVFADGLLVEAVDQPKAIDLYHRLSNAIFVGITDIGEGDDRIQEFDPCEDNSTIKLELNK